jgi:hypothetical protein
MTPITLIKKQIAATSPQSSALNVVRLFQVFTMKLSKFLTETVKIR